MDEDQAIEEQDIIVEGGIAEPDTPQEDDEAAKRAALEAEEARAEPVTQGAVVQDNVSEPGSQVTKTPDGEEIGRHSYGEAHAPAEEEDDEAEG